MKKTTDYNESLNRAEEILTGLNALAEHAIKLRETFTFPAYNPDLRQVIKSTGRVPCYKVYMDALYYELVMTVIRMFDSNEGDTVCFKNLFALLNDDFVRDLETHRKQPLASKIKAIRNALENLNGTHLVGRLKAVRHKMYAHLSTNRKHQVAEYGYAEKLLEEVLPILNNLNAIILEKTAHSNEARDYWRNATARFWEGFGKTE